jgi:hypothetical protein
MSSGGKRSRVLLITMSLLPLCLAYACGGKTSSSRDGGHGGKIIRPDAGQPPPGGEGGSGDVELDAGRDAAVDPGPDASGGGLSDAGPDVYDDPGCPDVPPPPSIVECDVFSEPSGCAPDMGCYPYVEHPFGEGCDLQSFGAVCIPVGSGVQGSECDSDTDGCAAGYACVVGAQSGKRCVKICDLNAPNSCDNGLICGETDVEGVGVCV